MELLISLFTKICNLLFKALFFSKSDVIQFIRVLCFIFEFPMLSVASLILLPKIIR